MAFSLDRRPQLAKRDQWRQQIADRLRELRGNSRQVDFAGALGITQQNVSRYEQGHGEPSIASIRIYCEGLGVNADWILFGTSPKYKKRN